MNFTSMTMGLGDLGKALRNYGRSKGALAIVFFGAMGTGSMQAQTVPQYLVTTTTTLATPTGFGAPNGNMATDQFGNLFVPDGAQSEVLEFPANGGAPIVIFTASQGPQVSGVAVDFSNNLYITTRYDSGLSAAETDIFKIPYTSSGYSVPYTYTGTSPGSCSASSTSVCNYGNFLQTAGGYYQPQAIGFDASGNGYLITTYDSLSGGGEAIFACDIQCGYDIDAATIAVKGLPTKATSLAVAANGDLYWADGTDVYMAKAGTGKPVIFDKSYESPYGGAAGVAFDRAGNLLVTNSGGTFEVPAVSGVITATNKFELAVSTVGGYSGPAVDNNGNVYTAAYSAVLKSSLYNYDFGALPLGSTSGTQTFTITFLSAGTITSLVASQGPAAATEFVFSQGTCAPAVHAAGDSCTFTASFAPTTVGTRRGTVVMMDSTGTQTYVFLVGVGQGTGVAVDPGTPSTITTTLKAPSGLALDASGNLFVADATAKAVYEFKGGAGTPISIGSGFTKPTGVAADGAGNVYVLDQGAGTVSLFASNAGSYVSAGTGTILLSGLASPSDILVSGSGSIYISNTGKNLIQEYPNASRLGSLNTTLSLGINLNGPTGLSLDPSGNLYVADTGNNRVVQLSYSGAQIALGSALSAPTGVAAEASGGILVADQGNGRVVRIPNEAGTLNSAHEVALSQPIANPYSIRLSAAGNLYVSDNSVGAIDILQRTAGTLNFGISNTNTPSAAQTVVVSSTGTSNLTLGSPFYAAPPASSNFTLTPASGATGCSSGTLTSGSDCTLTAVFAPTSTGTKTYTAPLNAPANNATAPSITLIGQGVNLAAVTVNLVQTSPAGSVNYGVPVVLTVTVVSATSSSTAIPLGTVTFNVDGNNTKPITLDATGKASYTLTGLGGNTSHTVIATYNGSGVYASGSSTSLTFTVQPATTSAVLTVYSADTSLPAPITVKPNDIISFAVTITPSIVISAGLSGTVNFVDRGVVIGSSPIAQNSSTGVYSTGYATIALSSSCLPGETLPNCSNIHQIQAVFAGNGNYSGFTTPAQTVIVTPATFTVVPSSTTITSTAAQYGSATLAVTSYSGFQAGVSLTCNGLPVNAYCIFRPGIISLTTIQVGSGTTATSSIPAQTTTMEIRVDQDPTTINSVSSFGLFGLLSGIVLFLCSLRQKMGRRLGGLSLCCFFGLVGAMALGALNGCSSGNKSYPTPTGTYPITLAVAATPIPFGQAPATANISTIVACATVAANPTAYNVAKGFACNQSAGTDVVITASSSNLSVGQTMTISGSSPVGFNGNFTILQVSNQTNNTTAVPTPFDVVEFMPPSGAAVPGSGGSVRLANVTFTEAFTLIVK